MGYSNTTSARQGAVKKAWKNEVEYVKNGEGTRDWTPEEQAELMERGSISGYEGHHMKNVNDYPEYAGDPYNIQFLDDEEHRYGAHQGNTKVPTNGYYDPGTGKMHDFGDNPPEAAPVTSLSEPAYEEDFDYADTGTSTESEESMDSSESMDNSEDRSM